jgi:hypothetical protein
VIVDNFNIMRTIGAPDKTDTPLIVDADAVLALAIALQRLELISWRYAQASQLICRMNLKQLASGNTLDVPEAGDCLASEQSLCIGAHE